MLRVNEDVNTVQNDTSNGWDDGATDDGGSSQPEPSILDGLKDKIAGIINGIGQYYQSNAQEQFVNMQDSDGNVTP